MTEITDRSRTVRDPGLLADDFLVSTDRTSALLESRSSTTIYTQYELLAIDINRTVPLMHRLLYIVR